jgi:hypothetical protein
MGYGRKLRYERVMEISMGQCRVFISIWVEGGELAVGLLLGDWRNRDPWVDEEEGRKFDHFHAEDSAGTDGLSMVRFVVRQWPNPPVGQEEEQ